MLSYKQITKWKAVQEWNCTKLAKFLKLSLNFNFIFTFSLGGKKKKNLFTMGMLGFQWQKYKIKSDVTVFLHVKVSGLLFCCLSLNSSWLTKAQAWNPPPSSRPVPHFPLPLPYTNVTIFTQENELSHLSQRPLKLPVTKLRATSILVGLCFLLSLSILQSAREV